MAHNILMASIIGGKTHLLTVKRIVKAYQISGEPIFDADQETVEENCKKAHEIIIASDFPSSNHYWGLYPKVGRRHQKEVVIREARQEFGYVGPVRVVFQDVGQAHLNGTPKRQLSCMVVDNAEVFELEESLFGRYQDKISHINSLPAALAAVVSHTEKPASDFMVIDVGESCTTIVISSSKGDVKVARHILIGFGKDMNIKDLPRCRSFFHEIEKDVASTNLYYLQQFQGSECTACYMFGSTNLQQALEQASDIFVQPIRFGFSKSPLSSINDKQAAAWAHLFGALYCQKSYNLLGRQIQVIRNLNRLYRLAMAGTAAAIIGCGLYFSQIEPVGADKIADYNAKNEQLRVIQQEVVNLQQQIATLNKFSGWESFYKNTYENQPSWGTLFSEMAGNLPKEIVIDSFRIEPGAGKAVRGWNGIILGHIKVKEWDKGLELFREFGAKIHRSPSFQIQTARYAPEMDKENKPAPATDKGNKPAPVADRGNKPAPAADKGNRPTEEISFNFTINVQLTSQDTKQ